MPIIVTGAASGIGRAAARRFARRTDARLLITDRDGDKLAEVMAELRDLADVEAMPGDLSDADIPARLVQRCVDRFGGVETIVSNAGAVFGAPLRDLDVATFDLLFDINTRPTWLLGKAAFPYLKAAGGAIIATASMSAENPTPPLGTYAASKAALLMLVRQMALEWGPDGIRANCVSPGPTVTGITASSYADPSRLRERASAIPLRKVAAAEDMANAIFFLASPDASYISGHNLVVDGGLGTSLLALSGAGTGLSS